MIRRLLSLAKNAITRRRIMAEGQDVEDRRLHPLVPAARQGDLMVHQGLRELSFDSGCSEILTY